MTNDSNPTAEPELAQEPKQGKGWGRKRDQKPPVELQEAKRAKQAKQAKPSIIHWKGLLGDLTRPMRLLVFGILLVIVITLTFTQFGFIGVGISGQYESYVVALLAPIVLAGLLLGMWYCTLMGFLSGSILLWHANYQPLDYYEVSFINPFSATLLFTITAFFIGWFLAIALRKNPPFKRRIVYFVIIALVSSFMFSFVFTANVMVVIIFQVISASAEMGMELSANQLVTFCFIMASEMGNPVWQVLYDALIMVVVSVVAELVIRWMAKNKDALGLRWLFRAQLLVVVALAYMLTAQISFIVITEQSKQASSNKMAGELSYLMKQIQAQDDRGNELMNFTYNSIPLSDTGLTKEQIDQLSKIVSLGNLLEGYTEDEDGVIVGFYDYEDIENAFGDTEATEDGSASTDASASTAGDGEDGHSASESGANTNASSASASESSASASSASASASSTNASESSANVSKGSVEDASNIIENAQPDVIMEGDTETPYVVFASDSEELFPKESTLPLKLATYYKMFKEDGGDMSRTWQIVFDKTLIKIDDADEIVDASSMVTGEVETEIAFLRFTRWNGYAVMMVYPASSVFAARNSTMLWTSAAALILLIVVFFVVSRLLTRNVIRRIDETNGVLARITDGDLNARVHITDSREFRSLSMGINTTVGALKDSIAEAQDRMAQELTTAKTIQESALPRTFPPFPDIRQFDVYASMNAAKEVGGDFYDFFIIDEGTDDASGKLGFVLADVSGKGVPAALFMMTAKTEIRNYLLSGCEPGEAIENANRQLCEGNDAGMFVTVFAGVLDYGTGHVTCVNAGHNPPLFWHAGEWRWLTEVSGMPLGLFDGFPYGQYELDMEIGDELFMYTDGVTEAMNVEGKLYGEDRLLELAERIFYLHPRAFVQRVRHSVAEFAAGAQQSDDITMLSLEYGVPPEITSSMYIPATVDNLPDALQFVHSELDRRLCPVKVQKQIDIAVEELFVNVAHYAYPDATPDNPGMVRVAYTYSASPPSIVIELRDKGVPYNPLAKPDAVTPDDIMEVPIGGLGILMAKNSVDEMTYSYEDETNAIRLVKRW